jgi:hypothetical protein
VKICYQFQEMHLLCIAVHGEILSQIELRSYLLSVVVSSRTLIRQCMNGFALCLEAPSSCLSDKRGQM